MAKLSKATNWVLSVALNLIDEARRHQITVDEMEAATHLYKSSRFDLERTIDRLVTSRIGAFRSCCSLRSSSGSQPEAV